MKAFHLLCGLALVIGAAYGARNRPFGSPLDPVAPAPSVQPAQPAPPSSSAPVPPAPAASQPPAPPAATDPADEAKAAALVRDYNGSLVFVEGAEGQGSGFIVEGGGARCLLTNQHVVAGNSNFRFTLLNQSAVQTGAAVAAVGHDVMRFEVTSAAKGLPVMGGIEKEVAIGDPVAVLGNAEGARVIRPFVGKVVGIGPELVEVNAEFVPGNSGSPIVHLPTGKVIGIATYATVRNADTLTGKTTEKQVRRFGYRLDSIKQWQPVNWAAYNAEYATVKGIEGMTMNFAQVLRAISTGTLRTADRLHPAIQRPIDTFYQAVGRKGVSVADRQHAAHELLAALRAASQSDIQQASARVRYDFFVHGVSEEQQIRSQIYKVFDEAVKSLR